MEIVAEMHSRVHGAEAAASEALLPIEETRLRLEQAEARRQALLEELTRLRNQRDTSAAAVQSLTQQVAAIKQAAATLLADSGHQVPRVK